MNPNYNSEAFGLPRICSEIASRFLRYSLVPSDTAPMYRSRRMSPGGYVAWWLGEPCGGLHNLGAREEADRDG